jgi:hypothetical protein
MFHGRSKIRLSRLCLGVGLVFALFVAIGWGRRGFGSGGFQDGSQLSAEKIQSLRAQLAGDWVASDVSSAIGPLKVEMVLRRNGSCHVNLWTDGPVVAQLRDKEGAYELKGDRICSELLNRGSCRYWFEGRKLMVEYKTGTILGFERKNARVALR